VGSPQFLHAEGTETSKEDMTNDACYCRRRSVRGTKSIPAKCLKKEFGLLTLRTHKREKDNILVYYCVIFKLLIIFALSKY
jgi:hypothetical protein